MVNKIEISLCDDDGFKCPICNHLILKADSDGSIWNEKGDLYGINACPHTVFVRNWGNDDYDYGFLFVREDYAKLIVAKIREDKQIQEEIHEREIEITEEECAKFIRGDFKIGDKISFLFANLGIDDDDLLSNRVTIYRCDHYHSGIHIAIEGEEE